MVSRIKKTIAEKRLVDAFNAEPVEINGLTKTILDILQGSHKTYKYILVTGLLAKACSNNVNPLALQAKAPLEGAYDARSLCHSVVVPFERAFLSNALGGSNEPFLNKPARFTHLSMQNAVRAGKDRATLASLIDVLSSIKTSNDATRYLAFTLRALLDIGSKKLIDNDFSISINPTILDIYCFIVNYIDRSLEGETCVISVGALEKLYYASLDNNYKVECHKVNQSGASSKEIGDIDIYIGDDYCYSIEIKDKDFEAYDFDHAMKKILKNGGQKGLFLYGPRANYSESDINQVISRYETEKFFVLFADIYSYARMILFKTHINDRLAFIEHVLRTIEEVNAKDDTKEWLKNITNKLRW